MPIYQYKCNECLCEFELKKSFTENPEAVCPQCGSTTRRLFSPPAVIFKGSGFYCTDHRSNACLTSTPGDKEKEKENVPAAKSETKPESKSETKTEVKTGSADNKK